MKDYEINENTLAIISKSDSKSFIYEDKNDYVIPKNSTKIMEDSCLYFGSSLEGRQSGSASILNSSYKLPVLVDESRNIIFFPTSSPRLKRCSWISLNNIDCCIEEKNGSRVIFKDGKSIKIPVSCGIINNQILRASRLQLLLSLRTKEKSFKNEKNTKKTG